MMRRIDRAVKFDHLPQLAPTTNARETYVVAAHVRTTDSLLLFLKAQWAAVRRFGLLVRLGRYALCNNLVRHYGYDDSRPHINKSDCIGPFELSAPDPKRQKSSRAIIDRLFEDAANVWVTHYSCESFYDRTDGRSPRITSIAVRKLDSGQTISFSIHQVAELNGIDFAGITAHYDPLERKMLDAFFAHVGGHRGMKYLHWNMRDINYGFAAIEHRYRVLGGTPAFIIPDENKFDLARLLIDTYGVGYTGHPRLTTLLGKNKIQPRDFLNGASEAEAFEQGNFVGLHQSTLRKVDMIANLAGRARDRSLRTNTTWWEMHGGRLRTFVNFAAESRTFHLATGAASIVGLAIALQPTLPASIWAAVGSLFHSGP